MIKFPHLVFAALLFVVTAQCQAIYKCSPVDGAMDTYSFTSGNDTGMACVYGAGTDTMLMYIERLLPTGERNIGRLHRLYPAGPGRQFSAKSVRGFLSLHFNDGETINLTLKPNGFPWIPADIRQINGCAMENPQIYLSIMDQQTMQNSKMMICAMGKNRKTGYQSIYGFGLRNRDTLGQETFIFLGKTANPIVPNAPLNIIANIMDICLKPDCQQCSIGFKSLTLSN